MFTSSISGLGHWSVSVWPLVSRYKGNSFDCEGRCEYLWPIIQVGRSSTRGVGFEPTRPEGHGLSFETLKARALTALPPPRCPGLVPLRIYALNLGAKRPTTPK